MNVSHMDIPLVLKFTYLSRTTRNENLYFKNKFCVNDVYGNSFASAALQGQPETTYIPLIRRHNVSHNISGMYKVDQSVGSLQPIMKGLTQYSYFC